MRFDDRMPLVLLLFIAYACFQSIVCTHVSTNAVFVDFAGIPSAMVAGAAICTFVSRAEYMDAI
jgi:hypothetical protein